MTEDDFLTLTLAERIVWLHSVEGPRGKLSHDRFAKILGTSRQTVISWEKDGVEPRDFRDKLSEFSGFRPEVFSRREAEELVQAMIARRLGSLEVQAEGARVVFRGVLEALAANGIQVQLPEGALGFLATPGSPG